MMANYGSVDEADPSGNKNYVSQLYSQDNGKTWKLTGHELTDRRCIGYSAKDGRFSLMSHRSPNDTFGCPWYNLYQREYGNFAPCDINGAYRPGEAPEHTCIAGNANGIWILGTGKTDSGLQSVIYYSTDNGETFNRSYFATAGVTPKYDSPNYWNGYFESAIMLSNIGAVVGNCPQWHLTADNGKTFYEATNHSPYQTGNRRRIILAGDRLIACGSTTLAAGYSGNIDILKLSEIDFSDLTKSNVHTSENMKTVDGDSVYLVDICYDKTHEVLVGIDWKRYVYTLKGSDYSKWVKVENQPSVRSHPTTTEDAYNPLILRSGNGVIILIDDPKNSGHPRSVFISSDGGNTWNLTYQFDADSFGYNTYNVSDLICGE